MTTEANRVERIVWGIIIAVVVLGIASTVMYRRYAARQRVEQARIIQEEKTKRTEKQVEGLKAVVPWAKDKP